MLGTPGSPSERDTVRFLTRCPIPELTRRVTKQQQREDEPLVPDGQDLGTRPAGPHPPQALTSTHSHTHTRARAHTPTDSISPKAAGPSPLKLQAKSLK